MEANRQKTEYHSWTIVEPQPCPDDQCTAEYIQGFFPDGVALSGTYDLVIHSHCIEHSEDIAGFFRHCGSVLKKGGRMIFALPDMERLLEKNTTSILNFEHTFLLTKEYICYLLSREGYELCGISRFGDGHSIVFDTRYTGIRKPAALKVSCSRNKQVMQAYFQHQKQMVEDWNKKMEGIHAGVFLFGAHISSQYYAAYGLDLSKIEAILDNDPYKIGKYVSCIDREVVSPRELAGKGAVRVIVPPSPYADEIKEGIWQVNEEAIFI